MLMRTARNMYSFIKSVYFIVELMVTYIQLFIGLDIKILPCMRVVIL